jgi:hypothetical protein
VDIERTMEFILDHQAKISATMDQFSAGMEEMREESRKNWEVQAKINATLGKAMLGLTDHVERLNLAQEATDARLKELAESSAASQARLDASIEALAAKQSVTEDRLNALIDVVDGMVRRPPRN